MMQTLESALLNTCVRWRDEGLSMRRDDWLLESSLIKLGDTIKKVC